MCACLVEKYCVLTEECLRILALHVTFVDESWGGGGSNSDWKAEPYKSCQLYTVYEEKGGLSYNQNIELKCIDKDESNTELWNEYKFATPCARGYMFQWEKVPACPLG